MFGLLYMFGCSWFLSANNFCRSYHGRKKKKGKKQPLSQEKLPPIDCRSRARIWGSSATPMHFTDPRTQFAVIRLRLEYSDGMAPTCVSWWERDQTQAPSFLRWYSCVQNLHNCTTLPRMQLDANRKACCALRMHFRNNSNS